MKKRYNYQRAVLDQKSVEALKKIAKLEGRTVPEQAGRLLKEGLAEYERMQAQKYGFGDGSTQARELAESIKGGEGCAN